MLVVGITIIFKDYNQHNYFKAKFCTIQYYK